jgi:hypothetical protein
LPSITSPTGSGSAAIARVPAAIAEIRAGSSARRSSSASPMPAARPSSMSRWLASTISSVRAISASAIACRAAFFVSVSRAASARAASRAARQMSETVRVAVAMRRRVRESVGELPGPTQLSTK